MKNIVLVLLAAIALIGSATAWDTLDTLVVDHDKTMYVQGGSPGPFIFANGVVDSGGYYISGTPYGTTSAGVFNRLMSTDTTPTFPAFTTGTNVAGASGLVDQTWKLSQDATAYSGARAINSLDGKPEAAVGYTTSQQMNFNGLFAGAFNEPPAAQAVFASEGNVGIAGLIAVNGFADLEHGRAAQAGMIETQGDATVRDAWIGMGSSASATSDILGGAGEIGNPYIVDNQFAGTVSSWAGFSGARGTGIVEANAGSYEQHVRLGDSAIQTTGFTMPAASATEPFPNW